MDNRTFILNVPHTKNEKDWFNFINDSLKHTIGTKNLIVNFNKVDFLGTDKFVVLACLIESFFINGSTVKFVGGSNKFNNHLNNVKFKNYWKKDFNRSEFTLSMNRTTLCLWKISEEMIYSYSSFAKKHFERFANNKDLIPLASNLDEVFNNIFDHSKSLVTGYIITQYYPKNKKLSFSVCDFGIGIPKSIKNTKIHNDSEFEDWKAIVKSIEKGFSINSTPRNRGFGLNNILNFTENANGKLQIISNNGILIKRADDVYQTGYTGYDFKGTLIIVDVDLTKFNEKDESEIIFDF